MSRAAAIGRTASAAVAAIALVLVVVLAGSASAAKPSPKAKLKLKTADQAALVDGGKARATVSYRGRKPKRMTLSLAAIQGGEKTVIAANEKIRARPGSKAKTSFEINRTGAPLVRSCLKTKLRLTARFTVKRGKTHVVAERKMKRDPARLIVKLAFTFLPGRARTFSFAAITVFSPPWIAARESVIRFGFRPR